MSAVQAVESANDVLPPQLDDGNAKRSINSYYGHKIGLLQTTSLVLNAGLMIYAHLGLSGVLLSSIDPDMVSALASESVFAKDGNGTNATHATNATACSTNDEGIWIESGGQSSLPSQAVFCLTQYNNSGVSGCFTNATCTELCIQDSMGYTKECSTCFGTLPQCGANAGCTFPCLADAEGAGCLECLDPCISGFMECSGFVEMSENASIPLEDEGAVHASEVVASCNEFDLDSMEWFNVYNFTFVKSVQDTWNNDAKLLAVFIVFFSGFWPYAKNVLLLIIWYTPMKVEHQTLGLLWLSRLSKFTLVDVFAVIGILVGVQLQTKIITLEVAIRAEPRFAILCFFLATVWEFLQIEIIKSMHERKVLVDRKQQDGNNGRLLFSNLLFPLLLLFLTIGLYIAGSITELIYFASTDFGGESICIKSYNVVTFGNAIISELSLAGNSVLGQTWFLYLVYVGLLLVLPIAVHLLQIIFIVGRFQSKKMKNAMHWATTLWYFSCLEVLVIGIFAVELKFQQFISNVAGVGTEGFLDIETGLGVGFYILIAYCVVASVLLFSLGIRYDKSDSSALPPAKEDENQA